MNYYSYVYISLYLRIRQHQFTSIIPVNTAYCYDLKLKVLSNKTTLVLSNTRELDRVPSTK